jgi:hypothetical protein
MSGDSDSNNSYQNAVAQSLLPPKVFANTSYSETTEVKVYKTRWFILLVYCINGVLQNAMWNTWGPIEATARAVYKWDSYVIDLMAAWGSITYCITMVPFAWIMDVKGEYFLIFLTRVSWYVLILTHISGTTWRTIQAVPIQNISHIRVYVLFRTGTVNSR